MIISHFTICTLETKEKYIVCFCPAIVRGGEDSEEPAQQCLPARRASGTKYVGNGQKILFPVLHGAELENLIVEIFCFFKSAMSKALINMHPAAGNAVVERVRCFISHRPIITSGDNQRRAAYR